VSKPTRLERLRAIERALTRSEDETAAVDAALKETREEIALERLAQKAGREEAAACANHNRRRLTALVAAGTKLDAASRLAKEAMVDIASTGLLPVEVREELQKIAADIDSYIQRRITSTIEHIP
jgi:hypothetical protein